MAKQKKEKEAAKAPAGPAVRTATPPRLKTLYEEKVRSEVMKQFDITNVMAAPRIEKVVLNIGLGEASRNIKLLDAAMDELTAIAGQRPTITRTLRTRGPNEPRLLSGPLTTRELPRKPVRS